MTASDLDSVIDAALSQLDRAATEAGLLSDPLERPFAALSAFLRGQRALYNAGNLSLAQHLHAARQPVRDTEFRAAVIEGVREHARELVRNLNFHTAMYLTVGALLMAAIGFAGGSVWRGSVLIPEIVAAQRKATAAAEAAVNLQDGFGTTIQARDAEKWADIIRMNPDISWNIRYCNPIPQASGSACQMTLWTMLPTPITPTPGTH